MKSIAWKIDYECGVAQCNYGKIAFYKLSDESSYSIASFTPCVDEYPTEAELSNSLISHLQRGQVTKGR